MIREVLRMGDPRLLQVAQEVTAFGGVDLLNLIADMQDTMSHMDGAGLAAPQIGVSIRVVIFGVSRNPRYPDADEVPQTVLINPVLEFSDVETEDGWEGCLSVPGLRGLVARFCSVRYRGFDQFGTPLARSAEGFHARVVQHECDHLDGILYPMRMTDLSKLGFTDVLFPGMRESED